MGGIVDDGAGYGVATGQLEAARTVLSGLADDLPGGVGVCVVPAVPATGDDALQTALSTFDTDWTAGDTSVWVDLTRLSEAYGQAAESYAKADARAQAQIAALQVVLEALPGWTGAMLGKDLS